MEMWIHAMSHTNRTIFVLSVLIIYLGSAMMFRDSKVVPESQAELLQLDDGNIAELIGRGAVLEITEKGRWRIAYWRGFGG
jgi:hypothetical protein